MLASSKNKKARMRTELSAKLRTKAQLASVKMAVRRFRRLLLPYHLAVELMETSRELTRAGLIISTRQSTYQLQLLKFSLLSLGIRPII